MSVTATIEKPTEVSLTKGQTAAICVSCELKPNGKTYDPSGLYAKWTHCFHEWIDDSEDPKTATEEFKKKADEKGYLRSLYFVQDKPVTGDKGQVIFMHLFENETKANEYIDDDEFREMVAGFRYTFHRVMNQVLVYRSGWVWPG